MASPRNPDRSTSPLAPGPPHRPFTTRYSASAATTKNSAGSSRLARRPQNAARSMRPLPVHSSSNSVVMRNPDSTKNRSTPRYPPFAQPSCRW